ncbi:alpha/beta hydrolase [Paenibacillus aquistagni]|uniref:alpha/beta hydrolase n=1 Tax=Paenibacillus aquistagni TaxID=1852522 RepID=UPI00145B8861|nr:alpha/beta hydrolase [Paenibacillus aquistagni]NMM51095.1 alpha/beta hydrolase [Paenibacillus aquistagni]
MPIEKRLIPSKWNVDMNHSIITAADDRSAKLAVLFPGMNYSCERPVLHYAMKCAIRAGYDVLPLEYGYQAARTEIQSDDDYATIVQECVRSISQVSGAYQELVFVGKSLGSIAAGMVSTKLELMQARHLFLTPVEGSIPYINQKQGITIYGTSDPMFSSELAQRIHVDKHREVIAIERANHGLEVEDPMETLDIMKQLAALYMDFFK